MSVVSILGGEWEIQFDDEKTTGTPTVGLKMITHVSGTTIRTANELYSAIADAMDELDSMDDQNPMLPTTPNAYTLENNYFMDNTSTEFLSGGGISSVDWTNEILCKIVSGGTGFVSGDIGRQILAAGGSDAGDSGILLDFETLPDGTEVVWIRPEDPTPVTGDLFDGTSGTVEVTTDGGTGTRTVTAAATTGEQLWSNVNVIGGIAGFGANTSEVYVVQDRIKLTQFWTTDPTASLGIIDILVRMQDSTTAAFPVIALGIVEVFNRRYTTLYDNFALDISAGGTNSLPLATAPDINNTTGYRNALYDAGSGTTIVVGDLITNDTVAGSFGIVTAENDGGATGDFDYFLVGDLTDFSDDDAFTTSDSLGNNRVGVIMGAPTANLTGPTDPAAGEGGTVTVEFGTTTVDHDGDSVAEPYSITVDAQGDVSSPKVYERLKYITRRGATAADLFTTVQISQAGEAFRGLQLFGNYDNPVGTFTEGDDITNETVATGVQAGIVLAVNTGDTYITVTDTSGGFTDGDTLDDEASDSVDLMGAPTIITPVKASPFGTLAGTTFFGSRGVVVINPNTGDEQAYILIDDNGIQRTPPNTVAVELTNVITSDVVFIADDTGVSGVIDKDRFGGSTTQGPATPSTAGTATFTVGTSIDADVPQVGFIRVLDASAFDEQRYRYISRTSTVFTLETSSGTATAGSGLDTLIDSGATFDTPTNEVRIGDIVRNTTQGNETRVVSIDSGTQLTTGSFPDGAITWATSDAYEVNFLTRPYTTSDDVYAPILDQVVLASDSGTVSNSLVQSGSFGIVVNVRQGKIILPFTQNSTVEATGRSIPVIRTPDTIAT